MKFRETSVKLATILNTAIFQLVFYVILRLLLSFINQSNTVGLLLTPKFVVINRFHIIFKSKQAYLNDKWGRVKGILKSKAH